MKLLLLFILFPFVFLAQDSTISANMLNDSLDFIMGEGEYITLDSVECVNCYDYYSYGKPIQYFESKNGNRVRIGVWKFYHSLGVLKSKGKYCDKVTEFTGLSYPLAWEGKSWPGPVAVYIEVEYLKDGTWEYYDEQGNNILTEEYVCGQIIYRINRTLGE